MRWLRRPGWRREGTTRRRGATFFTTCAAWWRRARPAKRLHPQHDLSHVRARLQDPVRGAHLAQGHDPPRLWGDLACRGQPDQILEHPPLPGTILDQLAHVHAVETNAWLHG